MKSVPTDRNAISAIRGRYYEALRQGMTPEAAADVAHGRDKPARKAPAPAPTTDDAPTIPSDWRDLPWPQLRSLAIKVNGGSIGKMTREDIEALIEAKHG